MKSPLIDRQRLEKLCEGSFEIRVGLISKLVTENAQLFSKSGSVKVLGTYPEHAIVCTSEGKFFRAKVAGSKISAVEEIADIKPLSEQDVNRIAYDSSKRAVDLLFEGRTEDAKGVLDEIFGYSDSINALPALKASLDKKLEKGSSWKRFLKENRARIKKKVGDVSTPDSNRKKSGQLSAHDYARDIVEAVGRIKGVSSQNQHKVLTEEYGEMYRSVTDDADEIAEIAMEIISRESGMEDLRHVHERLTQYSDDVALVTKYLGLAN